MAELARPILDAQHAAQVADDLGRFESLGGTPRAATDTAQIVEAAEEGSISELFFDSGRQAWGRYEETQRIVDAHDVAAPGDVDLIELAVAATLRHRGVVRVVTGDQLPSPLPMAAILRKVPATVER